MRRLVLLLGFTAALALPASAGAEVFCAPSPCVEGTPVATIPAAVTAADTDPGADTVAIAAGTHNLGDDGLFVGQSNTDVRGAGIDQTILTANDLPPGAGFTRTVIAGYMSRLADLAIRLPSAVTTGPSSAQGADIYNGLVENVKVDAGGSSFGAGSNDGRADAMLIRAGGAKQLEISFDPGIDATGLGIGANSGEPVDLEDVVIDSPLPLSSGQQTEPDPVTNTARRLVIHSADPVNAYDGYLEISDSVIDVSSAAPGTVDNFSVGIRVSDGRPPDPAGLTLDRVTFVGNGAPFSAPLSVAALGSPIPTFIRARHIVASDFGHTLAYQNYGSNPTATIDYSNVDTGPGAIVDTGETPGDFDGDLATGNRSGDPLLLPDLSLALSSPAIDIGGPDLLAGGPTDLAGNPRPADGDGNGSVRSDAGAFERVYVPDGAALKIKGKKIKLNRRGVGKLALSCPPPTAQPSPCTADLKLTTAGKVKFKGDKRKLTLAKAKDVTIPAGKKKKAKVEIGGAKLRLVRESAKARRVRAKVEVADGNGETGSATKKLKLKVG